MSEYRDFVIQIFTNENTIVHGHYYIYKKSHSGVIIGSKFLHQDFTLHKLCGAENFYKTEQIAKDHIDNYYTIVKGDDNFISEEEFLI